MAGVSTIPLSDWYELVHINDLMQGDILEDCPVFSPPKGLQWPLDEGIESDFEVSTEDVIVLSQSCDLIARQKTGDLLVMLCPMWKLSAAGANNDYLSTSYGKEECRRGYMPGYHMIAGCEDERWRREVTIVNFRELWSLPLSFLRTLIEKRGSPRPRMRSPYREHLAQAFARYFMRVGLPSDIPPFGIDKDEREIMRRAKGLPKESRERIMAALSDPEAHA